MAAMRGNGTAPVWPLKRCFHLGLLLFAGLSLAVGGLLERTHYCFAAWNAALSATVFLFLWHVQYHGVKFEGEAWYGFYYAPLADVVTHAGILTGIPLWLVVNLFLIPCRLLMIPVYFVFARFERLFEGREQTRGSLAAAAVVAIAGAALHGAGWYAAARMISGRG